MRPKPGSLLLAASTAAALAPAAPTPPAAAQTGCRLHQVGGYSQSRRAGGDTYNHFASGGVDYRCDGGVRAWADSAAGFQSNRSLQLFGNVRFEDPEIVLEAGQAYYFDASRQLQASQGAKITYRSDGTVVAGDQLIYDLASEFRPLDEILVYGGQPRATVFAAAAADAPQPETVLSPYEIDAERFRIRGRRFFEARGGVVVVRDSLRAEGDSLSYDQQSGAMSLFGEPRVQENRFDLTAESISLAPAPGGAETLLARGGARLDGATVALRAHAIALYLTGGELSRLVATTTPPPQLETPEPDTTGISPGDRRRLLALRAVASEEPEPAAADSVLRPRAFADDFLLVADSIDVASPEQALRTVVAVGGARAVATGNDSLNVEGTPEIARQDWMEGDTIVAEFGPPDAENPAGNTESSQEPASTGRALLESLTAAGSARSLYRLPSSDTVRAEPGAPPAVHLAMGQRITMDLEDGQVVRMHVEGQTVGYHFEPFAPSDSAAAEGTPSLDSAATAAGASPGPDSAAACAGPNGCGPPKREQERRR